MAHVKVLCSNLRGLVLNCTTPKGLVQIKLNKALLSKLDGITPIPQETLLTEEEFELIKSQFQSNPVWSTISVVKGEMGKSQAEDLNANSSDFAGVGANTKASGDEVTKQAKEAKKA